jgi:plasmid stabilization system protein ParE
MIEIDILPGAQRDIRKARRWYNKQRPGLGNEFVDEVETKLQAICKAPFIHAVFAHDARRATLKRFPYSILYYITTDLLQVVAVGHDKQDWRNILAKRLDV